MKIAVSGGLVTLVILFMTLVSCISLPATEVFPAQNPPVDTPFITRSDTPAPTVTETIPPLTNTLLPTATKTILPPTSTLTFTESPTITPSPTTTLPAYVQTTDLRVDVSRLSSYAFEVPAYTDLILIDIGNDGKSNMCRITGAGYSQSIDIPLNESSEKFQLPYGMYRLNCEVPNKTARILSR